jgi:hypothetical protein
MDDLINEIFNRSEVAVIAYTKAVDPGGPSIFINHNEASILTKIGLCEHLKHALLHDKCLEEE